MLNYADFFTLAEVAERLCIPVAAPQNYLLAPEASSPAASAHPARIAALRPEQTIQKSGGR
jgi:hypothetical protein